MTLIQQQLRMRILTSGASGADDDEGTNPFITPPPPEDSNRGVGMTRFDHEQSGLPKRGPGTAETSFTEEMPDTTPLLQQDQRERAWNELTKFYSDASATDLEAYYDPKSKRLKVKMAGAGKASYYLHTEIQGTNFKSITQSLQTKSDWLSANLQKNN